VEGAGCECVGVVKGGGELHSKQCGRGSKRRRRAAGRANSAGGAARGGELHAEQTVREGQREEEEGWRQSKQCGRGSESRRGDGGRAHAHMHTHAHMRSHAGLHECRVCGPHSA